jgi:NhaP-type Na+/H+ or K+/H+ antiporter
MSFVGILPEAQLTPPLVLFVFLPALLFEGAWTMKLQRLRENWQPIFFLAGPGVLLSLGLIACILHVFDGLQWVNGLLLFVTEAGGGIALGVASGFAVSWLVKRIDEPLVETTITIMVAYGIYLLADALHTSAIMAVICAGLMLGNDGRYVGMSLETRVAVDTFWGTLAFVANALIFLLVGVQLNPIGFFLGAICSSCTSSGTTWKTAWGTCRTCSSICCVE